MSPNVTSPGRAVPGRRPRPARATVASLVALVTLGTLVAPATVPTAVAVEGPGDPSSPDVRLVVTDVDAVVGPVRTEPLPEVEPLALPDDSFTARLLVDNRDTTALTGARIVVEVHDRVTTRSELRLELDGDGPTGTGHLVADVPLASLAGRDVAQVEVVVDGATGGFVDSAHDVTVRPVAISLVLGSTVLDTITTAAVGVARAVTAPLETTIVLPIDGPAPPSTAPVEELATELQPGGRVDRLVTAAEAVAPGVVTLAPAAHLLEDLTTATDAVVPGVASLRDRLLALVEASPSGVVSTAYGLADVPALAAQPATERLAVAAVVEGRRRLQALTGKPPGAAHLSTSAQTPASLEFVPVDVLVARWDSSAGGDLDTDPSADVPVALRMARAPSGRALQVLVGDPWVDRALDGGGDGPAITAHRVVVESAMTFAELPGVPGRPFAVVPPHGWSADPGIPTRMVVGLATAPWLRVADPVTVAGLTTVDPAGWAPTPMADTDLDPVLAQLGQVLVRMEGLASSVAELEAPPAVIGRAGDLLRATSTWPDVQRATRARAILDELGHAVDEAVGRVVVPDDSVITLASERGVIPITVQHPDGVQLDVVVDVTTQGRLSFEDGASRTVTLAEGGTSTVSFNAVALGTGTFPLAVTVRTREGDVVLARALVSVRATAVSRPALLGIGAVVLLLVVFGRRRRKAPPLRVVR